MAVRLHRRQELANEGIYYCTGSDAKEKRQPLDYITQVLYTYNPRRACARVTVVVVCLSVRLFPL